MTPRAGASATGRVVIVGAGVGGLAVAARLAAAGHQVTVCERQPTVGGKLGILERNGFRFDTGPSLLTMPQVLAETFAATGTPMTSRLELRAVEPIARYRFADGTVLDASADPLETAAALEAALQPGSGADWQRLMRRAERIWTAVDGPFLRSPLRPVQLARRWRDLPAVAPHRTLRHLGERYLRDPRLRMLLDRYATYAGSDPRRAPAALAAIVYAERRFGAWYVAGGLRQIAVALAEQAAERGARVLTGAEVCSIDLAGGRVSGVRLASGRSLPADVVVANADARHVYTDLLRHPRARRAARRLGRSPPSLSGFALLLGVRGRTHGIAHHNVLFPADYDAEFDALFGADCQPVRDPTVYAVVPRDGTTAPPGHEAWFVLVNAPRQGQRGAAGTAPVDWRDRALVQRYREHLLDVLERRGWPLRSRLTLVETRTPHDLATATGAPGGAIYGSSSNGVRAAFVRPSNRSPVPGLFLVGGSTHPGGGLPLVLRSAAIVADLIGRG